MPRKPIVSYRSDYTRETFKELREMSKRAEGVIPGSSQWGYIYVVRCHQYYKIGITSILEQRLSSLQCGNPYELEIIYAIHAPYPAYTEEKLHARFKEYRHFREWFILPDNIDWKKEIYGVLWPEK